MYRHSGHFEDDRAFDFDGDGDSYWSQCSVRMHRRLSALKRTESGRAECAILRFRVDPATATARQDLIGRLLQYVKSEAFPTTDGRTLLTPIELLDKQATTWWHCGVRSSQTSYGWFSLRRTDWNIRSRLRCGGADRH